MSIYEHMAAYQLETGLPATGSHRNLADRAIQQFAVSCESCKGSGAQYLFGEPKNCAECQGFRKHLSPAVVRRLHQIVTAAFPSIRAGCATENAARRWAARKSVPATRPMHLGLKPLPASVPQVPDETALAVCSLTWRRGLRSEFLWSGGNTGPCVLWERLPDLTHHDGVLWCEVFAWTPARTADPGRSALRLLQRGRAKENLAHDWLAAPKRLSQLTSQKACSVTSAGSSQSSKSSGYFCLPHEHVVSRRDRQRRSPRPSGPRQALRGISDHILLPQGPSTAKRGHP